MALNLVKVAAAMDRLPEVPWECEPYNSPHPEELIQGFEEPELQDVMTVMNAVPEMIRRIERMQGLWEELESWLDTESNLRLTPQEVIAKMMELETYR